jgi:hypothetical protein
VLPFLSLFLFSLPLVAGLLGFHHHVTTTQHQICGIFALSHANVWQFLELHVDFSQALNKRIAGIEPLKKQ